MQTKLTILASIFLAFFSLVVYPEHNVKSLVFFIIALILLVIAFILKGNKDKQIKETHIMATNNKIDYLS